MVSLLVFMTMSLLPKQKNEQSRRIGQGRSAHASLAPGGAEIEFRPLYFPRSAKPSTHGMQAHSPDATPPVFNA
jgi:hypothetical protein